MRYRLVLLTHGDAPHLDRVVESFAEHITPSPADCVCVIDGPGRLPPVEPLGIWRCFNHGQRLGFCAATAYAWTVGAANWNPRDPDDVDYVFHLEHDFILTRGLYLPDLAVVLDANPKLAQMSLMRQPVSADERLAGGVLASRPGEFIKGRQVEGRFGEPFPWLEHTSYMTTNPSLMRRQFMVENPWPDYPSECEGRFGIDLVERGYTFGVWGGGDQWVEHVGVRDGIGY